MCVIHYWICVVCKHGSIRWTTECDVMRPPLLHCPTGYIWDYTYCDEEDCCMQRYHPYVPLYLVGQGEYTQYSNGKPTGLNSHTRHASTQTESTYQDQFTQTDGPAVGMVGASTTTYQKDALISTPMILHVTRPESKTSSDKSTQMGPTYQDSHVQTKHRHVVSRDASTVTTPQDTFPITTRLVVPDLAPMSSLTTPSMRPERSTVDNPSDDDEYFTAKETMTDDEFTLVVGRRKRGNAKRKKGNRGGNGSKTSQAA